MNFQEFTRAANTVAKIVGIAIPVVGTFRTIVYEAALLVQHPPSRPDGTSMTAEEVSQAVLQAFASVRQMALDEKTKWEEDRNR